MNRKNLSFLSLLLCFLLFMLIVGCEADVAEPEEPEEVTEDPVEPVDETLFITLAAGSPGGAYFPLGAGIAKVITDKVDGVWAQSETTGASVENCRLVALGESEMGMAMANIAFDAYSGTGAFEEDGALPIMSLFSMYPAPQHLITLEDSDIYSLEDLVGKKVSIDAAGSGCAVTSEIILRAAGIWDDVEALNYSQEEAADALKDGVIDALFYNIATPAAAVTSIEAVRAIRFISLDEELIAEINADYPYLTQGTISAGTYTYATEDVTVINIGNLILVHEDMDEDLAYNILSALFTEESLDELVGIHPAAQNINLQDSRIVGVPLHPGADRFFSEN